MSARTKDLVVHEDSDFIKKDIGLIYHEGSLSLTQKKVMTALMKNAQDALTSEDTETFCISLSDVCYSLGIANNDRKQLKENIRLLQRQVVEFDLLHNHGERSWTSSTPLAEVSIEEGRISYSLPPKFRSLLRDPIIWGNVNLPTLGALSSKYTAALYEMACASVRKRNASTAWMTLVTCRQIFGAEGVASLKRWTLFKIRVIDKAVEEVNEKTEFHVSYQVKKSGRTVTHIRFFVSLKDETGTPAPVSSDDITKDADEIITDENKEFFTIMVGYNVHYETILKILRDESIDVIKKAIVKTEPHKNKASIKNIAGLFIKTLNTEKEVHQRNAQIKLELEEESQSKAQETVHQQAQAAALLRFQSLKSSGTSKYIEECLANLSESDFQAVKVQAINSNADNSLIEKMIDTDSHNIMIKHVLVKAAEELALVGSYTPELFSAYLEQEIGMENTNILLAAAGFSDISDVF